MARDQSQGPSNEPRAWKYKIQLIYHKSALSKMCYFSFISAAGRIFHFWVHIIFNVHCSVHHFSCYELFYSSLIWILFLFTLFVECFSTILKNITHALYKQKRSCKAGRNVYMRKERSTKVRSRVYESGILPM